MPQLTITNHSGLYTEVLNSLNKNASDEMSEYLHDKIRKHAMKQARRNHSVFPHSSANFVPWFIYLALGACGIQESDVKITCKGTAANCVAIILRFRNIKASALHYRIPTTLSKLTTKYLLHEKS